VVVAKPTLPQNLHAAVASHTNTTAKLHVTWSAPANDGDGAGPYVIGLYKVTVTPAVSGGGCTTNGVTLGCDIDGFTLGVSYKLVITATNTYDMTSDAAFIIYKVPARPAAPSDLAATILSNENSRATVKLTWSAPSSDGGSPITGYSMTGGTGISCTTPASTRTCTITGLWTNRTFTFSVVATNVVGSGPAAQISVPIPASATDTVSPATTASPIPSDTPTIPPSPSPTPTPTASPTPTATASPAAAASSSIGPVTPAGSTGGSGPDLPIVILVAAGGLALVGGGGAFAWKRSHALSPSH
jgi:hypothetical protein